MLRRVYLVAQTVWLEFLRRKDFYVLLILVGLFVLGIVVIRVIGIENAGTARFLMSCGSLLSYALAAVLTAATAARQLPSEIENRTLLPLLAKPISRSEVILGKWLAVWLVAFTSLVVFVLLSWVPIPKLPGQNLSSFVQMTVLRMVSLCLLGICTVALSLCMPSAIAVLIGLAVFFAGSTIVNFVVQLATSFWRFGGEVAERLLAVVPDFSVFEHSQRYVQGAPPMTAPVTLAVLAYGFVFGAFFYSLTVWSFNHRSL